MSKLNPRQIDRTYHPRGGVGFSESLKRARKPYILPNIIVGSTIAAFAIGVYAYSISAVKQDDFSDIDDLLPPLEARKAIKSIEDELREQQLLEGTKPQPYDQASSPSALAGPIPGQTSSDPTLSSLTTGSRYLPRRLSDWEWIMRRGWVESGKGNVLVWGAPNVDNIGAVEGTKRGPRLV